MGGGEEIGEIRRFVACERSALSLTANLKVGILVDKLIYCVHHGDHALLHNIGKSPRTVASSMNVRAVLDNHSKNARSVGRALSRSG